MQADTSQPLVSSEALQALVKSENLLKASQELQDIAYATPGRNRVFGSKGHNDTVLWIYDNLAKTGYYDVQLQTFVELFSGGDANLAIDGIDIPVSLFTYTPRGSVMAPIVPVIGKGCDEADYPADVIDNIALISRGDCAFAVKATNAKSAGAKAAIVYDNVEGDNPTSGTLGGEGDYVPTVGVTKAVGEAVLHRLRSGSVKADLNVNSILENRTTFNVVAETKYGDHNNVLALGGHTDSVVAGPGINDDGSGTVGILEVAKGLAKFKINNAIRFCFWTAEEYGLLGSTHYVKVLDETKSELAKIRAYLNFDMIASPNYIYAVYDGSGKAFNKSAGPPGSAEIEDNFKKFFQSKDTPTVPTAFDGRSDYGPFLEVGIASGGTFTGAEEIKTDEEARLFGGQAGVALDVCYHQACDNMTNLAVDAFTLNTQAIADAVAMYALSFDSLGPRPRHLEADHRTSQMKEAAKLGSSGRSAAYGTWYALA